MAEGNVTSATRGVVAGGYHSPGVYVNVIEYITLASTGDATDFGDLTEARSYMALVLTQLGRIWWWYKNPGTVTNVIDYITIASTGDAADFGDLTVS